MSDPNRLNRWVNRLVWGPIYLVLTLVGFGISKLLLTSQDPVHLGIGFFTGLVTLGLALKLFNTLKG